MNLKLNDDELRTNPRRSVPAIWQQIAVCGISVKKTGGFLQYGLSGLGSG